MTSSGRPVTDLLNQWAGGDPAHTLQATALVHEAYMRLIGDSGRQWENRAHFFGVAGKAWLYRELERAGAD
jgi:hypothetical protein